VGWDRVELLWDGMRPGCEFSIWDGTGFPDLLMGRDRVGMGFPGLVPGSPEVEMQRPALG
jgi:hypothetical protein